MLKLLPSFIFIFLFIDLYSKIRITPNREDRVFHTGETISWQITIDSVEKYDSLRYAIKPGALSTLEEGMLKVKKGKSNISYTFDKPGSVILEIRWGSPDRWQNRVVDGGICDPEDFQLSSKRPDDFKEFWSEKIAELEAIPMNSWMQLEPMEDTSVVYAKVLMDNIRGSKIQAQMAMPNNCEKYPALLIVQWAGVYGLSRDWVINRAREGWLVLNINPHDLPIDMDPEFYQDKSKNELKNYPALGNEYRDSSYFLRMYLSCYRGVEFLKQYPSWNGKTIVVTGDSQGGMQTIVTAGLHPDITAAMALVPAGFDMLGPELDRKGGWPQWYQQIENKDSSAVREASRYYDAANFVPDISCPVLVGVGLLDETCPPQGIIAGMNQIDKQKKMIYLPQSQHQDR
ncbi:MAG: acetylxylan esterase, partial [Saprospiraceae bacterium]|nr:acetylxylan esterase [Saprospiraceae bacterium]